MLQTRRILDHRTDLLLDEYMYRLRDIELLSGDYGDWNEQQFTSTFVLMVVISGEGDLRIGHSDYRLREQAVYLCPPNETFGAMHDRSKELKMFLLRFDIFREHRAKQAVEKMTAYDYRGEIPQQSAGQLTSMCLSIHRMWRMEDTLARMHCQLIFQEILYSIFKNWIKVPNDQRPSIEVAKQFLESNYQENVAIEQLASLVDISPKYFVDLFKKKYGTSAIEYLTELRIKQAKQLMNQTTATIRDIAHQVGYQDEFYFSRKFKKKVGMSPSFYMKKRQRKIAAYHPSVIGHLLALNIIPYAAPLHPKWTPYYYNQYREDIPFQLSAYRHNQHWESNIEILHQAQSDLVISRDQLDPQEKKKLDTFSSILYIPESELDWREQLLFIAKYLDESSEAEHFLLSYERKVKVAREKLKLQMKEAKVLIVRIHKEKIYLHCSRSILEVFHHDLQLTPACTFEQLKSHQQITVEQLMELDVDHLLVMIHQEPETLAYWKALKYSMAWQELKAIRNGNLYLIPSDPWLEYSALAHDRLVTEALKLFSGNCPS